MEKLALTYFWNRLKSLQWLCSEDDENAPKALLIVPGPDGRNNASAVRLIKYLFKGAVGKDLFDETLDTNYESLEDMILLIKQNTVSVLYTEQMKNVISFQISHIPNLIEYVYTKTEEEDIDLFQIRKCISFKKLILEALNPGDKVGIAVPVGYEDVLEVEGWPILQAFAMDQVYCPTGFFTARHGVIDITSNLETIFRTVDAFYLENASTLTNAAIVEHMNQFISVLDAPTVSQRERITAEDAIAPLEVLYEFGEMDTVIPLEQSVKPVLLFGPFSNFIGNALGPKASKWKECYAANCLHAVVEASEPTTGLRWCRTYFLQQGTSPYIFEETKRLKSALAGINFSSDATEEEEMEEALNELQRLSRVETNLHLPSQANLDTLSRLMTLYTKLWFHLRQLVYETFLTECDVLEAGTEIQRRLGEILNVAKDNDMYLHPHEKLQLHIDCLNALGEIVTVEDVDDMGGVCWTYIRASIHGIRLQSGSQDTTITIAVGDTFLFSPLAKANASSKYNWRLTAGQQLPPFLYDTCCITHAIPYFRALIGAGVEEEYARLISYCSKNSIASSPLEIGKPIEVVGSNSTNVVLLSNNLVFPHAHSEIKFFSSGFILNKINAHSSTPIVVSFAKDISKVWTVDFLEGYKLASDLVTDRSQLDELEESFSKLPSGILVVFELKSQTTNLRTALHQSMPNISFNSSSVNSNYLAIIVKHNERTGSIIPFIMDKWKTAMRVNDIEEFKTKAELKTIPTDILHNLLLFVDSLKVYDEGVEVKTNINLSELSESAAISNRLYNYPKMISFADDFERSGFPGFGFVPMRCMHVISEIRRLSAFDFQSLFFPSDEKQAASASKSTASHSADFSTFVIAGLTGCGINNISTQLINQIGSQLKSESYFYELVELDFNAILLNANTANVSSLDGFKEAVSDLIDQKLTVGMKNMLKTKTTLGNQKTPLLVVAVTINPVHTINFSDFLTTITSITKSTILNVSIVLTSDSLFTSSTITSRRKKVNIEINKTTPIKGNNNKPANSKLITPIKAKKTEKDEDDTELFFITEETGIGKEYWNSLGAELVHMNSCDTIIVLESNTNNDSFIKLRKLIDLINPSAQMMKVSPLHLFFSEEDIAYYTNIFLSKKNTANSLTVLSERVAFTMALGYPLPTIQQGLGSESKLFDYNLAHYQWLANQKHNPNSRYLQNLCFFKKDIVSSSSNIFSISLLLKFFSSLFPSANKMMTNISYDWNYTRNPMKSSQLQKNTFHRLLSIAMKKVLTNMHVQELEANYQLHFDRLTKSGQKDGWIALLKNILSIKAVITIENERIHSNQANTSFTSGHQRKVLIEANHGNIIYREISAADTSEDYIICNGLFTNNNQDQDLFRNLLQSCEKVPLSKKTLLVENDFFSVVTNSAANTERREYNMTKVGALQNIRKYREKDLPNGCWFDGSFFIDHNGGRYELRPDIDQMIEDYINHENNKRRQFNEWIDEIMN